MNRVAGQEIKFKLNIPNIVTATRVILAMSIAGLLLQGSKTTIMIAGSLLIFAALTDWLDGFLARRLGQTSLFGVLFDLVADEILFMPSLILAVSAGLFSRADNLMPLNPYLYAIPALVGGIMVLAGVGIYLWKRRQREFEFPTPTRIAKLNYWFWLAPLILAILDIGPDLLLAITMYLAIISTLLTFYSYLKKGSYVFTD